MNAEKKVYVIMPVLNRRYYTERCLYYLHEQSYKNIEIIVIDDKSTDGTVDMIREKYPGVKILHGNGNLWWLGAVNAGIKYLLQKARKEDLVLLINNDLRINKRFIEKMVANSKKYHDAAIGAVESKIDAPNIIINGGNKVNWWLAKGKTLNVGKKLNEFTEGHIETVSSLTGRGVMYPVRVVQDIGLLDIRYVHMGDFEYAVRAKQMGYKLIVAYNTVVYHYPDNPNGIVKKEYRWSDLYAYLADERSYSNIRNIYLNSRLCTKSALQGISYFIFDLLRITGHFIKNVSI